MKIALQLRKSLELYQARWQRPKNDPKHRDLRKDFLYSADWDELQRFHDFLQPFYILTKTIEGNARKVGQEGGHGAIWETLKIMDYLFSKFNTAAESCFNEPESHFKTGIDYGWAKLEQYYNLTDCSAVYRAALALHPSYGYDYFESHWKETMDRPSWYWSMKTAVSGLFSEYQQRAEAEAEQAQQQLVEQIQQNELDDENKDTSSNNDYSSFGKRKRNHQVSSRPQKKTHLINELAIFQERDLSTDDYDCPNPLEWWHNHQQEYPVLYQMALDLFSIPGMSAECERVFSQAKKLITDERNRLSDEVIEANQLQKHWLRNGLVE
jgi:hypothetical protein